MDDQLVQLLIIIFGYGVTVALLLLGRRAAGDRADGSDRRIRLARFCYSAAGLLGSTVTLFLFTDGTFAGPWVIVWVVVPLGITLWIWWRKRHQQEGLTRLVARTRGVMFEGGGAARPSFGVLPSGGQAVACDDPAADFQIAVELTHGGRRVLGVQYVFTPGVASPSAELGSGPVRKLYTGSNTFSVVQLSTPLVPTVLVRQRLPQERSQEYGPVDMGPIRPGEDGKFAINTTGSLRPAAQTEPFRLGDGTEFDKYFAVTTADPDFARALLTPDVVTYVLQEPEFRVTDIVFDQGTLRSTTFGRLTDPVLLEQASLLTALADLVAPAAWQWPSAVGPQD
ncbi:MAG: hypothetical protein ACRDQB_01605 [Thermocrispum sp.]